MTQEEQAMVDAIRADKCIGKGTCTSMDECYSDEELITEIRSWNADMTEDKFNTPIGAVKWGREQETACVCGLDQKSQDLLLQLDQRWGEDDDPQVKEMDDWIKLLRDNPVMEACIQDTDAYKWYTKGVISGDECNEKLRAMGYTDQIKYEINEDGRDIATGFKVRESV